jgi:hypothetical protein
MWYTVLYIAMTVTEGYKAVVASSKISIKGAWKYSGKLENPQLK